MPPHGSGHESVGAGVDGGGTFEVCEAPREVRDESPAHQDQFSLAGLFVIADDGLVRGGSDVVIPRRQDETVWKFAQVEGLGGALPVGSSYVAATHGLDVDRKSVHLAIHDMKGLLTHCQATQVAADVNVVAGVGKRDSHWPDNRFRCTGK